MALRDQPYFPLYVQDYLTDEKLNMCSAATQGVFIKMMCLFHKSEEYGGILLKQKDKQSESMCLNFAHKLAKLLPFDFETINQAVSELLDEKVLQIDGDFLHQKRMVKDNEISLKRASYGKKGGKKTQQKIIDFAKANDEANIKANNKANIKQNPEYENEYEYENINRKKEEKNNWKSSFEIYLQEMNEVYIELIHDKTFIQEQEKFHPGVDILLSLEKAKTNFWGTESGWQHKKKSRSKEIKWKLTFINAIEMNKVYKPRNGTYQTDTKRQKDYSLKR